MPRPAVPRTVHVGRKGVVVTIRPGEVFGTLTVLEEVAHRPYEHRTFRCRCICGRQLIARMDHLRRGETRSCAGGCLYGVAPPAVIRVKAFRPGQHGQQLIRRGVVFDVAPAAFSPSWMRRVTKDTPEQATTGQARLDQMREEKFGGRVRRMDVRDDDGLHDVGHADRAWQARGFYDHEED